MNINAGMDGTDWSAGQYFFNNLGTSWSYSDVTAFTFLTSTTHVFDISFATVTSGNSMGINSGNMLIWRVA
jgi:hypothetical protein